MVSKRDDGSITIEAAIIFPIIVLTIVLLFHFSIYVYEGMLFEKISLSIIEENMYILSLPLIDEGIYWRFKDDSERFKSIKISTNEELYDVLKISDAIDIDYEHRFNKVNYSIKSKSSNQYFDNFDLDCTTVKLAYDPCEFIRNSDFILDNLNRYTSFAQEMDKIHRYMNNSGITF